MGEPTPTDVAAVKVTVYMMPAAYKAVARAAERDGMSRTDVINRAAQVYEAVTGLKPGERASYDDATRQLVIWR